jgi:hypothetical protein
MQEDAASANLGTPDFPDCGLLGKVADCYFE